MAANGEDENGILTALLKVQGETTTLPKDGVNPHFKSKYTPLDTIVEKVGPILNKHGLVWMTLPVHDENGEPALYYRLAHAETGTEIAGTMPLLLTKRDPQGMGSAITYARRYSLCAVLNLVADDDDDGNAASAGDVVTGARNLGPATAKQLTFLKRLVTQHHPPLEVLSRMIVGVGAKDVDPSKDGWSKQLTQDQVSGLIDVFMNGALPTGESDIPNDLPFSETAAS